MNKEEIRSKVVTMLLKAKTEEELEAAADLADEAVIIGAMTQDEVDAMWDDLEPDIYEEDNHAND